MTLPRAFTLIELLVVVAIISILASIAVPNFLEAQTRAKVSRVKADHRALLTAAESYGIDWNNYPPSLPEPSKKELAPFTTPIAYISTPPTDPFAKALADAHQPFRDEVSDWVRYRQRLHPTNPQHHSLQVFGDVLTMPGAMFFFLSPGPDLAQEYNYYEPLGLQPFLFAWSVYDPTNGTISTGELFSFGSHSRGE